MEFLKKHQLILLGVLVGALLGYAYYHFIGCTNGCTITSSPYISTLYGAVWGGLFLNLFNQKSQ